jgi:hypothetical protein
MRFFTGLHQPSDAKHFDACFISINRIRNRKGPFTVRDWVLDSGAFTEIKDHGRHRFPVSEYAGQIRRWSTNGNLLAAACQDWMCEPEIIKRTGRSVADHQRLTIENYDALVAEDTGVYILPALQGFRPAEYVDHIRQYGDRLKPGMWLGVGSVCKRKTPAGMYAVLSAIRNERPDLKLHGFGVTLLALMQPLVVSCFHTCDSMAWSYGARFDRSGGGPNDYRTALAWTDRVINRAAYRPAQEDLFA